MANNRMWLVNENAGERILLAKYYPSGGWAVFYDDLVDRLNALFVKIDYPAGFTNRPTGMAGLPICEGGQFGDTGWRIEYEEPGPSGS